MENITAVAVGSKVLVNGVVIKEFDKMADDYAYTNAKEYAEQYNKERSAQLRAKAGAE